MRNENLRQAIWFVALFFLTAWMLFGWLRYPPQERFSLPETPFERTSGLDLAHWSFLQEARDVLPPGVSFTIRASSTDDEMKLFMLSGSVLTGHRAVPSSYYGERRLDGDSVPWILSYRCEVVPPGARVVMNLSGGCVCERGD
jgi:hypothetical protein